MPKMGLVFEVNTDETGGALTAFINECATLEKAVDLGETASKLVFLYEHDLGHLVVLEKIRGVIEITERGLDLTRILVAGSGAISGAKHRGINFIPINSLIESTIESTT